MKAVTFLSAILACASIALGTAIPRNDAEYMLESTTPSPNCLQVNGEAACARIIPVRRSEAVSEDVAAMAVTPTKHATSKETVKDATKNDPDTEVSRNSTHLTTCPQFANHF